MKLLYMNHLTVSIILFILAFSIIHLTKPNIIYNEDGSLRDFGVGYRRKTIIPLWLVVFILAILSYYGSLYLQGRG